MTSSLGIVHTPPSRSHFCPTMGMMGGGCGGLSLFFTGKPAFVRISYLCSETLLVGKIPSLCAAMLASGMKYRAHTVIQEKSTTCNLYCNWHRSIPNISIIILTITSLHRVILQYIRLIWHDLRDSSLQLNKLSMQVIQLTLHVFHRLLCIVQQDLHLCPTGNQVVQQTEMNREASCPFDHL
jgi:hypothetical protein